VAANKWLPQVFILGLNHLVAIGSKEMAARCCEPTKAVVKSPNGLFFATKMM
jgi:hypothetical protein